MPTTPSITRSVVGVDAFDDPAAGVTERRQALLVGPFRLEQYRVGGHAAAAQEGRGPQCVAAVVARADDRAHPSSGDSAGAGGQLDDDRGRQSVCRTPHQRAVGQAGQQRRFGLANRVRRVVVPHCAQITGPATRVQSIKQANYLEGVDMARTDNDTWDLATSVGATATGVAVGRALANRADNPLINDPFAEPLVRAVGVDFFTRLASGELDAADVDDGGEFGMQRMGDMMAVRTRFFDDFFIEAADGGIRQAVILASGLDARGYRLPWPDGTTVYEIDQPTVIEFKSQTLADLGAAPDRRPARGGDRSAPRLARRAARSRPRPDPAHRVERRRLVAVPAAGGPGCACWTTSPCSAQRAVGWPPRTCRTPARPCR